MMLNDSWTVMNNSSTELDSKPASRQKRCCSFLFWSVVMLSVFAVVATATVIILYLNQFPLPFFRDSGAVVSVSRGTEGEPISIFLDPSCPDLSESFLRWEALQSSLLRRLTNHNADDWQETGLARTLGEELKVLTGHAHNLRLEADSLKTGQGVLEQRLDVLQSEQSRTLQVLQQLHSGVSDSLLSLQRETDSLRRTNQDLQTDSRGTAPRPSDCRDVLSSGVSQDGVYSVFPTHDPDGFMVYCDMTTDGGGWMVIQRREDGSVNFFRDWGAYRDGFGKTTGEHWLGLQRMYALTGAGGYELRIDMADFDNVTAFALYEDFSVGRDCVNPEEDGYPLSLAGYSGTAGDSLQKHAGMRFTTRDRDQDQSENNCASYYQGAWWYRNCHTSNLNGQYLRGGHASYADGVEWSSWTGWQYSLRFTEMKIRPKTKPNL
ncbi:fibrinogen C domain-containing protein 1-like isoform X2 [Eleginops maclovinus]|uniref:fibrinogen C domain-containing protein 1-like isoform X2 n=1 Tax=Eleginops maclovinus TaxID=56733 RepID=UPI003080950E